MIKRLLLGCLIFGSSPGLGQQSFQLGVGESVELPPLPPGQLTVEPKGVVKIQRSGGEIWLARGISAGLAIAKFTPHGDGQSRNLQFVVSRQRAVAVKP